MPERLVYGGVREAARATGLPRDLLYAAIKEGRLAVIRSGVKSLVPVAELARFVAAEASAEARP
jgi:excisionase family DNA binding protein